MALMSVMEKQRQESLKAQAPTGASPLHFPMRSAKTVINKMRPPKGFDDTLFEGRWCNDDVDTVRQNMERSGYQVWGGVDANLQSDEAGSGLRLRVGVKGDGDGHGQIFMYRPKSFRKHQDDIWRAELKERMAALDPRKAQGGDANATYDLGQDSVSQMFGKIDMTQD